MTNELTDICSKLDGYDIDGQTSWAVEAAEKSRGVWSLRVYRAEDSAKTENDLLDICSKLSGVKTSTYRWFVESSHLMSEDQMWYLEIRRLENVND